MLIEKIVKTVEFNDLMKAHVQIIGNKIEMLHSNLYKEFSKKHGLESIVFKVMDNEISRMYSVIKQETINRKKVCAKYGVVRVSDLNVREISEEERNTTQKLFLHILLPKTEKNRNIDALVNLIRVCIPLDIHFILYQSLNSKESFIDAIGKVTSWKIDENSEIIVNKIDNIQL